MIKSRRVAELHAIGHERSLCIFAVTARHSSNDRDSDRRSRSLLRGQASPNMAPGYQQTYDRMLQQIRQIAIFDDHGHPGFADDSDVDAMASSPSHPPLRLQSDNPGADRRL